jgi:hypothetical protein
VSSFEKLSARVKSVSRFEKSVKYYKFITVVMAVAALAGCRSHNPKITGPSEVLAASSSITRLFSDYYEERLKLYPMEATQAGDNRYNDQLPNNLTEEFRGTETAFYQKIFCSGNARRSWTGCAFRRT